MVLLLQFAASVVAELRCRLTPKEREIIMRPILCSIPFLCLLALPLLAQDEALHGTWEGTFVDEEGNQGTTRLTFQAGGGFQLEQVITLGESFQSVVEASQVAAEKVTAEGSGTYQVNGDKIKVEITEFEMLVDGRDFVEVLTEIARALAAFAAEFAGISEEDYPAFEENFVNEFLAGFNEEEFLAGLDGEEVTYAIEGDTLYITSTVDGVEETTEFQRVGDATSVSRTSWGDLKASVGG